LIAQLPHLDHLGRRCSGARVEFKTDSPTFTISLTLKTLSVNEVMSICAGQALQVLLGERENIHHLGFVSPPDYNTKTIQRTFQKSPELEQITIFFPRDEQVESIEISVEDGATVTEPTPYKYEKPVLRLLHHRGLLLQHRVQRLCFHAFPLAGF